MTLANDSVLVTPGSGASVATHAAGGKEHQLMMPATELGHIDGSIPTFFALSGQSAFGASKFHFVLYNASATAIVRVLAVLILPGTTAVTGVASGPFTMRRRVSPTTAPAGGALTIGSHDTGDTLPASITAHNAPTTAPAGGTTLDLNTFLPQADEAKLTTLDASNLQSLQAFGGLMVYNSRLLWPAKPLTLRQNQGLEIQQDATAGTGNCKVLCIFTAE